MLCSNARAQICQILPGLGPGSAASASAACRRGSERCGRHGCSKRAASQPTWDSGADRRHLQVGPGRHGPAIPSALLPPVGPAPQRVPPGCAHWLRPLCVATLCCRAPRGQMGADGVLRTLASRCCLCRLPSWLNCTWGPQSAAAALLPPLPCLLLWLHTSPQHLNCVLAGAALRCG